MCKKNTYRLCKVKRLEQNIKSRCKPRLLIKCMKTAVFYCKCEMHVRPMRFSILCTSTDSCDKTQLMHSTILLCLLTSKYDINGSRLNYSTVSRNKFKYINRKIIYKDMCCSDSVALKTLLDIRLGICIYKTSLRPDDCRIDPMTVGFTPCCPPQFTTKLGPCCQDQMSCL